MTDERQWFKHAEEAGFVFLGIPRGEKATGVSGWTKPGAKVKGKFPSAGAALDFRGDGRCNLGVGTEQGSLGRILDADDDVARDLVEGHLHDAGVTTLSMDTPRGRAWLFTLPTGTDLPPLKEHQGTAGGIGALGVRTAGQYQVAPGSMVEAGAYSNPEEAGEAGYKPPPDDSGGPWHYRARDVAPVATMPEALIQAIVEARAKATVTNPGTDGEPRGQAGAKPRGRAGLGCRTVEIGIAVLRDLVRNEGSGRNDAVYRVACSMVWHRALTRENHHEVEAELIDVQRDLRAGESRDVTKEVPEQIDHAFKFIAEQGGPGVSATGGGEEPVPSPPDDLAGDFGLWRRYREAFREQQADRAPRTRRDLRGAEDDLLARIRGRVGVAGEVDEPGTKLDALRAAFDEGGDAAVKATLEAWEREGIVSDPVAWETKPEEREWLVPGWLPCGRIGMVTGKGESGKSRLTLQLAAVLASGGAVWIPGSAPVAVAVGTNRDGEAWGRLPVVVATWEDESDELRRRLHGMAGVGIKPEAVKGKLHHADMSGAGPLWAPAKAGGGHVSTMGALTGAGRWLRRECEQQGAKLLLIDPLAAAYACSENDRGLVRHFMSDWDNWGRRTGCAVLVVAHPSKDSTGSADYHTSGSTDWHAASRFVWKMERMKVGKKLTGDDAKDTRPEAMRLEVTKSNYGIGAKPATWLSPKGAGWKAVTETEAASGTGFGRFGGGR